MKDPIEEYEYPKSWIESCLKVNDLSINELKEKVLSGFYIILPDGNFLRRGITTGTAVSAAIKAAILSKISDTKTVCVKTPIGLKVWINYEMERKYIVVRKFSGDHAFDITNGIKIYSKVLNYDSQGIIFGEGIGIQISTGEKAISTNAYKQIMENYNDAIRTIKSNARVYVKIPDGIKIWKKTSNQKFGIVNGISILGTTGFVEPWCHKLIYMKKRLCKEMYKKIVLTTGRTGFFAAKKLLSQYKPIVVGKYIKEFVEELKDKDLCIISRPALLLKAFHPELKDIIFKQHHNNILSKYCLKFKEIISKYNLQRIILVDENGKVLKIIT